MYFLVASSRVERGLVFKLTLPNVTSKVPPSYITSRPIGCIEKYFSSILISDTIIFLSF